MAADPVEVITMAKMKQSSEEGAKDHAFAVNPVAATDLIASASIHNAVADRHSSWLIFATESSAIIIIDRKFVLRPADGVIKNIIYRADDPDAKPNAGFWAIAQWRLATLYVPFTQSS